MLFKKLRERFICNNQSIILPRIEQLEPRLLMSANPIITEFMADNKTTLPDGNSPAEFKDWIEIYNAGDQAIDLQGWHLTDKQSNLDKWTFPSTTLDPGAYLIVFASNNDNTDPQGNLHTNFALNNSGEYLALVRPDLSIASAYEQNSENYPEQFPDVSYGLGISENLTILIDNNDNLTYLLPTQVTNIPTDWNTSTFDDATWNSATNGVGYNIETPPPLVPGFFVRFIDVNETVGSTTTAQDIAALADGTTGIHGPYNILIDEIEISSVIDYAGGNGTFAVDNPYPDGSTGTGRSDFVLNAKATVTIPEGTWQIAIGSDDGGYIILDDVIFDARFGTNGTQRENEIRYEAPRAHNWTGGTFNVGLEGLTTNLDAIMYERGGGDTFEIAIRNADTSESVTVNTANDWFLLSDNTLGWEVLSVPLDDNPEGAEGAEDPDSGNNGSSLAEINTYEALISSDVQATMFQNSTSVLTRFSFSVDDITAFDSLRLRMNYDDGFVAYINGIEVARSNANTPLTYDSTATLERTKAQAITRQDIPLNFDINQLDTAPDAENILAIHGLNLSDVDDDFLLQAELIGVRIIDNASKYFADPTPGQVNGEGFFDFVQNVAFSFERGFYDSEFQLVLDTPTESAQIYYTLNGIDPTESNATLYNGPITIDHTSTVRAVGVKLDFQPSTSITHTYIFVDDVVQQDYNATIDAGFPTSWGGTSPDYGLDPDVIGPGDIFGGEYANTIKNDLKSIPTLSIVTDIDFLFGSDGIYTHSTSSGIAWERPTSFELIYPDGTVGFQVNAAIRIQGGAFRSHGLTKKHSFRLLFKGDYGPTKLEYDFFGEGAVTRFDTITLRSDSNDGWQHGGAGSDPQYARDEFARQSLLNMGQPVSHGARAHVYINGIYWGLYNPVERPDASFAASYWGGDKDEWDALNAGEAIDGNTEAWNTMLALTSDVANAPNEEARHDAYNKIQGLNPDGTDNPDWEDYLDVDSLIDYMIINIYGGNLDWPGHNWYAARQRGPESTGWKFIAWDTERTVGLSSSVTVNRTGVNTGIAVPYDRLRSSEEFRLRFADRVQEHFSEGGTFYVNPASPSWDPEHPENNVPAARYYAITQEINEAIVGESARWGDQHVSTPYTKQDWIDETNSLLTNYFPQRSANVLNQLRNAGLYPSLDAPTFNQNGGEVAENFELTMSSNGGTIYYTTDGTDPRLLDDTINPNASIFQSSSQIDTFITKGDQWNYLDNGSNQGTAWREVGFDDSSWSTNNAKFGYGDNNEQTLLDFGPNSSAKYTTTYFRKTFNVTDPLTYDSIGLEVLRDDGVVIYLNGQEVVRSNMPGGDVTYTTNASSAVGSSDETTYFNFAIDPASLVAGQNTIAVELHQANGTSSDTGFDLAIKGTSITTINPLILTESGVIMARSFDTSTWSALSNAEFFVGTAAASGNLAITEINYNPQVPTDDELLAGFDNNDQFEFIELKNIGLENIDLYSVQFTEGISFDFTNSNVTRLNPGEFVLLVTDQAAFEQRYGNTHSARIAGTYTGSLSNGGEDLEVTSRNGDIIQYFEYDNNNNWPGRADGNGSSLEVLDTTGDYNDPDNWRSSLDYQGSPAANGTSLTEDVIINEILAHTDFPQVDAIELYNTTAAPIDISGWWLSDSNNNYQKFIIPDNTIIDAFGYVTFDESHFNLSGGVDPNDFALSSSKGDDIWLIATTLQGDPDRFVDHVEFNATQNSVSLGRWINGDPNASLFPMAQLTLNQENTGPRLGELIISEVQYHPDPNLTPQTLTTNELEYLELFNTTGAALDITNWRIEGAIEHTFASTTTLAKDETIVLVAFDPTNTALADDFYTTYGISPSVRLIGPFTGQLSNGGERISVEKPDTPEEEFIPYILIDEVRYDDVSPWPTTPDGLGDTLNRNAFDDYGNFPASWSANTPTPGNSGFVTTPPTPGDFNDDSIIDDKDIDLLAQAVNANSTDLKFDLTGDTLVNSQDTDHLIFNILNTQYGDATLDGVVNLADLGKLATNYGGSGGWTQGDFNGDGIINLADLGKLATNYGFNNNSGQGAAITGNTTNKNTDQAIYITASGDNNQDSDTSWSHIDEILL